LHSEAHAFEAAAIARSPRFGTILRLFFYLPRPISLRLRLTKDMRRSSAASFKPSRLVKSTFRRENITATAWEII
jgi:hypothetical protein